MRKTYTYIVTALLSLICLPLISTGAAQVRIDPLFADSLLCRGGSFTLPFIVDSEFYYVEGNLFKVQLSDANGNFGTNPLKVGEAGGLSSGTISCTIPTTVNTGTGYRLRIVSTTPAETSANNGKNLRISDYPTVTASNNSPLCPDGSLQFTGITNNTSNNTFSWTGPNGYTNAQQNPIFNQPQLNANGIYTLAVTYYGCTKTDTTKVIVVDPPNPWIRPSGPVPVCRGAAIALDAQDTSNTPGLVFSWTGPKNFTQSNPVFHIQNADSSNGGVYVLKLSVGTCVKTDSVLVKMLPRPDTAIAANNGPVCIGDTVKLSATSPSVNVSYHWTGPNNFSATGQYPIVPNITNLAAGDYIVTASFLNNGCTSLETKTTVVVGAPLPVPTIKGNVPLCRGDALILTAYGATNNLGIFTWTGPSSYSSIGKGMNIGNVTKAANAGTYYVVQHYNGCESPPAQTDVVITEVPEPVASNNSPVCDGSELNIYSIEIDSATYEWTGPKNFTSTNRTITIPVADTSVQGNYKVTARIANCTNTSSTKVVVNLVPKITDITSNSPVCKNDTLSLKAITDLDSCSFAWAGPGGYNSTAGTPLLLATEQTEGTYSVIAESKNCFSNEATIDVKVKPLPEVPTVHTNSPVQEGSELQLSAECATPGVTFEWTGVNGFRKDGAYVTLKDIVSEDAGVYYVDAVWDGCKAPASAIVTVLSANRSIFGLYPNPGDGLITLSGLVQTTDAFNLQVYNAIGQPIHHEKITPVNKKFSTAIDLRGMPAGIYIIYIKVGKEEQQMKFVIE